MEESHVSSKTQTITNTKLAVATAFLGVAALAAAATGGVSTKACVGDGVIAADTSQMYTTACQGQTIEYKDSYGTVAYFYVRGFSGKRAIVVPLYSPGNPAVYAVGSPNKTTSLSKGKTVSFNFPSGNGVVTHSMMYRGSGKSEVDTKKAYFALSSTGPSSALTCDGVDESFLVNSPCPSMANSAYACFNKFTGDFVGCSKTEDDFSNCSSLVDSSDTGINCLAVENEPSCEDSDGGLDYYTYGQVTFSSSSYVGTMSDYCNPSTSTFALSVLHEYSCGEYGPVQNQEYCEFGCVGGACVASTTLSSAGKLYVSLRNTDPGFDKDRVVLAGNGFWAAKLRLSAEDEPVMLIDLKLANTHAYAYDSVESVCIYTAQSISTEDLVGCTDFNPSGLAFFEDINHTVAEGTENMYVYVNTHNMSDKALGTADSGDFIAMNIASTTVGLVAHGVKSGNSFVYGALAAPGDGKIVFDSDLDGTFDDIGTATGRTHYITGSRISNVELVSSYGGEVVDSLLNGAGEYTLAILAITNENNNNTDASGIPLMAAIDSILLDVEKSSTSTISEATLKRIGGVESPVNFSISQVDGIWETSGDWTIGNLTTELGADAKIAAGNTAYYAVKAVMSGLWIRVGLDDIKGGINDNNNNIDWFDGYDKTYATWKNFDYLFLDTESITGSIISGWWGSSE
jgi:hypothetical protein